jgi:AraC-like DNA-binding protein
MQFRTYKIDEFKDLVDFIWFLEHNGASQNVVTPPNQYFNMTFSLGTTYKRYNQKISTPQVEGLDQKPVIFEHSDGNKIIGIRFLPFGLYPFHNANIALLINSTTELEKIVGGKALSVLAKLKNASDDNECITILKDMLFSSFKSERNKKIKVVQQGYFYFRQSNDERKLYDLNKEFEISYPTLNRHFTEVAGISPKKMERLLKFRKSICTITSCKSGLTNIGLEAGYFDQAHFIKEFSSFMGCSPKHFYKSIKTISDKATKICYNFSIY